MFCHWQHACPDLDQWSVIAHCPGGPPVIKHLGEKTRFLSGCLGKPFTCIRKKSVSLLVKLLILGYFRKRIRANCPFPHPLVYGAGFCLARRRRWRCCILIWRWSVPAYVHDSCSSISDAVLKHRWWRDLVAIDVDDGSYFCGGRTMWWCWNRCWPLKNGFVDDASLSSASSWSRFFFRFELHPSNVRTWFLRVSVVVSLLPTSGGWPRLTNEESSMTLMGVSGFVDPGRDKRGNLLLRAKMKVFGELFLILESVGRTSKVPAIWFFSRRLHNCLPWAQLYFPSTVVKARRVLTSKYHGAND